MSSESPLDQQVTEYIRRVLQQARPHLFEIERMVKETRNGVLQFELKVYNGDVTDILVKQVRRIKM